MPDAFGKNHATILTILKKKGILHRQQIRDDILALSAKHRGLGMSMKSEVDAMKDLLQDDWKMVKSRKEGRGKGRVYSITQNGEKALLEWEGKIALSKRFSYDLGFKKFGVIAARVDLPYQCYLTYTNFFEDTMIEPIEELCTELLKSWNRYLTDQPVDMVLEIKLNSEAIDDDILYFREELVETQDRVKFLLERWYEESGWTIFDRFDQYNLFPYAFELVICEEELRKRGIQLTFENYQKMKKTIFAKKKEGESLIDFCFSINGKVVDFKRNQNRLPKCALGETFGYLRSLPPHTDIPDKCFSDCPIEVHEGCVKGKMSIMRKGWTILDEMKEPKIDRWIRRYRKNLDDWFPYIPWNNLGFPKKLTPSPCALPKDLFIPMKEQICDANIRILLHFLARLPADKAVDSWNFYFEEAPTIGEFDDYTFLMTYHLVKRELKYSVMPEDIRTQAYSSGTLQFLQIGPKIWQTPFGSETTLEEIWYQKDGLASLSEKSKMEMHLLLNEKTLSRAKQLGIFELFDAIYRRWERAGKPFCRSRKIFRLLQGFLERYKLLTEENKFKPEDALDEAARLIKTDAKDITF